MAFYFRSGESGSSEKVNYVEKIANGERVDFGILDQETLNDIVEDIFEAADKETDKAKLELYLHALESIRLKMKLDSLQQIKMRDLDRKIVGMEHTEKPASPFTGMHAPREPEAEAEAPAADPDDEESIDPPFVPRFEPEDEMDKFTRYLAEITDKATGEYKFDVLTELDLLDFLNIIVSKKVENEDDCDYLYSLAEKIVDYMSSKGIAMPEDIENKYNELASKHSAYRAARESGEEEEPAEEEEEEEEEDVDKRRHKKGKHKGKKSHKGIKITCIGVALVTLVVGGYHLKCVHDHKDFNIFTHGKTYSTAQQVYDTYTGDASNINTLTEDNRAPVGNVDNMDQNSYLAVIHNYFSEELELLEFYTYEATDSVLPEFDIAVGHFTEIVLGEEPVPYRGKSVYFNDLSPEGKEHILEMFAGVKKYYRTGAEYSIQDVDDIIAQARTNMSKTR